jgi:hypothetical protein
VNQYLDFDVTADVSAYLNRMPNYGWLLKKAQENEEGRIDYTSREGPEAQAPQLVLVFEHDPRLDPEIVGQIREEGLAEVTVVLRDTEPIQEQQERVLAQLSPTTFAVDRRYSHIHAFTGQMTEAAYRQLVWDPDVINVYLNFEVQTQLVEGRALIRANPLHRASVDGRGVTVAVIDTGIDYRNLNLGGCFGVGCKVKAGFDFFNNDGLPIGDHYHGTAVAGIIAGDGGHVDPTRRVIGVAPKADLVALKACGSTGLCPNPLIDAALNWILQRQDENHPEHVKVDVVNISLGDALFHTNDPFDQASYDDCVGSATAEAVRNLAAKGVSVFASSGNETHSDGITWPACIPEVISVGAVYDADVVIDALAATLTGPDEDDDGIPLGMNPCVPPGSPLYPCTTAADGSVVGDNPCIGGNLADCDDNCPSTPNNDLEDRQNDRDADGVGDRCDNCPDTVNPDQLNTDDDELGDACDACVDRDGDEFGDRDSVEPLSCPLDNCPYRFNPPPTPRAPQLDSDTDGLGDACDLCPAVPGDLQVDADGDGHGEECDTCPAFYNPDNTDSDGDGQGDACECYGIEAIPARPSRLEMDSFTDMGVGLPASSVLSDYALARFGRMAAVFGGVVHIGPEPGELQSTGAGEYVALDSSGRYLVFSSGEDFLGQNPDGSAELFLWRKRYFSAERVSRFAPVLQITDTPSPTCTYQRLRVTPLAEKITYISDCDPTGGNPDGNFEIFLYDQAHNTTRQLTATENCTNGPALLPAGGVNPPAAGGPSLSRDGAVVAFTSSCRLAAEDRDTFPDAYVHYVASGSTVLLPDCASCRFSYNPELSASGRYVTYYSALWDEARQLPASAFLRWVDLSLPDRPATGLCPGTPAGTVAAFPADTDRGNALILHVAQYDVTGENEDLNMQVFLTNARTGETRQVPSSLARQPLRGNVRLSDNGQFGAFVGLDRLYRFEINR